MIDDAALDRLSGLFAEEREEERAESDRKVADLKAGREVAFAQRFGKYGLIRELGRGGLGRVWLAWDPELRRFAALKTLSAGGEEPLRRLLREARMAARLDHPRVAKVYEIGEAHGVSFIAMQYLEGASLEGRTLEPLEAARVVRDAARILHWAHERGVVHRDVKPGNLLLCAGEVHVVDFGLAKPVEGGDSLSAGAVVGTLAYMSPEQAAGRPVGPEADVYSLGATLYRLAAGRPPVEARSVLELRDRLASVPPPRTGNPALDAVVLKALDAPPHRTPSAEALAADLDRVLRGEPVARRFRLSGRQKLAIGLALLAAVAIGAVLWRGRAADRHLAAADAALAARDFDRAARSLDLAAGLSADVTSRREALARSKLETAHRLIEKARALIEESRVNLYRKGARLSETFFKDLDAAAESARRSVALAETADARLALGRIAMLLGDYEGARREYARALELDRTRPVEGRLGQARAYVQEAAEELIAGHAEQGLFLLESARGLFDALPGLARRVPEGGVESQLIEAWRRVAAGDLDGAVDYATARTSASEEFLLALGLAQFRRGDGREALRSLTAAIDVRPNYYQAFLWRGLMLRQLGNAEFARRDVERALEIHPRYARARAALAELDRP